MLQQHLPFTVLKRTFSCSISAANWKLQQHLPFTVLKRFITVFHILDETDKVATAPTVYGIETYLGYIVIYELFLVATAPTVYGIETIDFNMMISPF